MENISDFVIRYKGHSKFNSSKLIENSPIEVIVQKLENLLFTNRGEVMGSVGFGMGADIEYMLWETKIPNHIIKQRIKQQISKYIPELDVMGYDISEKIYEGKNGENDILSLDFVIKGYNISFVF